MILEKTDHKLPSDPPTYRKKNGIKSPKSDSRSVIITRTGRWGPWLFGLAAILEVRLICSDIRCPPLPSSTSHLEGRSVGWSSPKWTQSFKHTISMVSACATAFDPSPPGHNNGRDCCSSGWKSSFINFLPAQHYYLDFVGWFWLRSKGAHSWSGILLQLENTTQSPVVFSFVLITVKDGKLFLWFFPVRIGNFRILVCRTEPCVQTVLNSFREV